MVHEKTNKWIISHLLKLGKVIIAACGEQMGIHPHACSEQCHRKDKVVYYREQTIRCGQGRTNKFGEVVIKRFIIDLVLYLRPGSWGLSAVPSQLKCFSVGIEIKENLEDLRQDNKIQNYLDRTDFFFLMVPSYLVAEALRKNKQLGDPHIGVLSYSYSEDSCRVVKTPHRQKKALIDNKFALAMQSILGENSIGYSAEG